MQLLSLISRCRMLGRPGEFCPNLIAFSMSSIMFINEFVWMYRSVLFKNVRFAVVAGTCCFFYIVVLWNTNSLVLCVIKMFIKFFINSMLMFFQNTCWKPTLTGDRVFFRSQLRPFSVSQVVSTYIYMYIYMCVYLAGVTFVFDKGHVASSETASTREKLLA